MDNALLLTCSSITYSHPGDLLVQWRVANGERSADIMVSPDVPPAIRNYLVDQIAEGDADTRQQMLQRIGSRTKNIHRFFASNVLEVVESLQPNMRLLSHWIEYDGDSAVTMHWKFENITSKKQATLSYSSSPGTEITMDKHFLQAANKRAVSSLDMTKRDLRKTFVVTKRTLVSFPKVIRKNTPLRGLYGGL